MRTQCARYGVGILAGALWIACFFSIAPAAENVFYRAGYVIGFRDAQTWKTKDPSMTAGRYAEMTRDALAAQGPVPRVFWRGLRDGFRDAVRAYTPKFTAKDVDVEQLPAHLRP
ncbi:MAG: hypothetical protein WHS46_11835 [Desulfosoma sp.]